ncbi:ATP-dependent DNA helicase PIF1 [Drosophila guanche]|uniref:ATP-dependent DNA helicase PIF1 n=1 Tax=Drosophila guanche TaxID=7266 RepID=A0A3B0JAZ4_DROGU|nr:ATP-dependent DNA helicase PIF1 [Drosophila guanche]SPP79175.1 blast:ATP-dependent DNA helicase PIF1 [Drosophila guanche]
MDLSDAVLTCAVSIQWTNAVGITGRKLAYKTATLRLVRNDVRELFVEVTPEKLKPLKFKLKDLMVHKKFMAEGKATFNFKAENCALYLSNAPPGTLMFFLRTIFIKMNGDGGGQPDEASMQKKLREHLLSGKPTSFEDVSPVTTAEMLLARKKAGLVPKATTTTPSPQGAKKRRFDELKDQDREKGTVPAAKKLYQSSPLTGTDESLRLSEEQMEVLRACTTGKNVFFTGSAGTGKSFLLRRIISALPPDGTIATASTGVAACLIGGTTLHAFAGIGGGDATMQRCLELASRPISAQTWRKCKRLIIDEISMVDGQFFEKIEAVARHIRRNDRPFGGIQLILCGDFLQLPPVIRGDFGAAPPQQRFCFQSSAWETCIQCVYELKQVHRQSDPEFVQILNHLRIGHVNETITSRLAATSRQKIEGNGILATQLCSHTNDANSINESKLENLKGDKVLFRADDSDAGMTKQLDQQVQAPSQLYLKVNAQVMLLKNINISNGLVNGARGVVVRMEKDLPVVRFKNNQEYVCKHEKWIIKTATGGTITRRQVPLKLAWAFSIHKSQGLTLDCVEMSLSKVFEAGQAYVALSRAKSLQSVRILDFDAKQVWANPQVLQFYKGFRRRLMDTTMIPLGPKNKDKRPADANSALAKIKKSLMSKPLVSIS